MGTVLGRRLKGSVRVPGDKSIAHRLALLGAIAEGETIATGFPSGADCRSTLAVIRSLGVTASVEGDVLHVDGVGLDGLEAPGGSLDAGNSGTTARLCCGLLAGQSFDSRIIGDQSLSRRPFRRVEEPLAMMGARLRTSDGRLPIEIEGGRHLTGINYELPVPSAQVKSAVLLAGLYATGPTRVRETSLSRDHTEIALRGFGLDRLGRPGEVEISGRRPLTGGRFRIPGDFSSAAFFIAAAACLPGSELIVEDVGLNPTRTGLLDVLAAMGARIELEPSAGDDGREPAGTIRVTGAQLEGVVVPPERMPAMIDEIPALAVAATRAAGETVIRGASELRHKETDRLDAIASGLTALGAGVDLFEDGLAIRGGSPLKAAALASRGDHRMVMAWAIASLLVGEECTIDHRDQVTISYPGFWTTLGRLAR